MPNEIRATYRLQLRPGFGFDEAAALADYLAELGVSHLYTSPSLQAAPGSTHGYDVVDHHRVSEDLGGRAAHARLTVALRAHGLGQVLDIVPNHMAISPENAWWWDVLRNGPGSRYASYFDVDWDPPEARLSNSILLPVLGNHYGRVLEAGELTLLREGATFTVRYYERRFPVAPRSLDALLITAARARRSSDLAFIADALGALPLPTATDRTSVTRRSRDQDVLEGLLARLLEEKPALAVAVDAIVAETNDDPDMLGGLLDRQPYRLAYWRTAGRDLGYRRFFDINSLIGLRTEDERVFADTHVQVITWVSDGVLDGLRIDHPDGLRDPETYLRRLTDACPDAWIVVEKILEPEERLPDAWPVAGTTGYDFLNRAGALFVDPAGEEPLTRLYQEFTGAPADFASIAYEAKHLVMRDGLGSDVNRLTALWLAICEHHRRHRDYTRHELHDALRETLACFPVYRTYLQEGVGEARAEDVRHVEAAVRMAKQRRPDLDPELFDFLRDLLLLRVPGAQETELALRFQQLSGPVMAKGVEDTACYRFNRLVALNEVGGDPSRFGLCPQEFHHACVEAQRRWPQAMLATSTHDTKRSEDVRARISLLSEMPDAWAEAVRRWSALNERHRGGDLPDRNAEYLLYQTLAGAWPIERGRVLAYMEKAARESKVHTSWTAQNAQYESALRAFVEAVLGDREFIGELEAFVRPLVWPGRVNSLALTLLRLTAPGVPDIYQGTELWDFSLVDPDNRRPVDFDQRRRLLAELRDATPETVLARADEGLPKLWLIQRALALRRARPRAFGAEGAYRPLAVHGACADHVVAFSRGGSVVSVAPRLVLGMRDSWGDTALTLPRGRWRNELTGETVHGGAVRLSRLLRRFPVALLAKVAG